MEHERKWCTCDRCGADLCYKCMEDFEEFMRNDR